MNLVRPLFDKRIAVAEADLAALTCDESELLPAERAAIPNAVPRRRREFVAGRVLARRAMESLGLPARPVLPGSDRAPIWPREVVGSISHSRHWCAVVLAHAGDLRSIGVDIEAAIPAEMKLWPRICTTAERAWLDELPVAERGLACKLLFCAKEACYKAQYPLTGQFLGFHAVEIRVDRGAETWQGVFQVPSGTAFAVGDVLLGRYSLTGDQLASGVVVPR
jgi:4'-phosphopantetheinyl transferase EntD